MNGRSPWFQESSFYLSQIKDNKPLSTKEEARLAKLIQRGDLEARNKLVKANLLFVVSVAHRYRNRGLSLGELIGAGNEGLMTAAERFDGTRGFRFISYAVGWVRQAMLAALAGVKVVHCPSNHHELVRFIIKAEQMLSQELGRKPTLEETASVTGRTSQEINAALVSASKELSLDKPLSEDHPDTLLSVIIDQTEPSPDDGVVSADLVDEVESILGELDEREAEVVRLYFGIGDEDGEGLTLEEIGKRKGLTRERIRQIKEIAIRRLRHTSRRRRLKAYFDAS